MSDDAHQLKQAFDNLDAAWTAHHARLAARMDALTGLVLALCQKLGLDRAAAERLLAEQEKMRGWERLAHMEDTNPGKAALAATFLELWEKGASDSPPSAP